MSVEMHWHGNAENGRGMTFAELRELVERVQSDAGAIGLGDADGAAVFATVDASNAAVRHIEVVQP